MKEKEFISLFTLWEEVLIEYFRRWNVFKCVEVSKRCCLKHIKKHACYHCFMGCMIFEAWNGRRFWQKWYVVGDSDCNNWILLPHALGLAWNAKRCRLAWYWTIFSIGHLDILALWTAPYQCQNDMKHKYIFVVFKKKNGHVVKRYWKTWSHWVEIKFLLRQVRFLVLIKVRAAPSIKRK